MKTLTTNMAGLLLLITTSAFTTKTDTFSLKPNEDNNPKQASNHARIIAAPVEEKSRIIETPKVLSGEEDKVFTTVEINASFPVNGGWAKYLKNAVEYNIEELIAEGESVTCKVRFIILKDGSLTGVEALTMKDSRLAKIVTDAIKKAPKWMPAQQNGYFVNAYREQEITFTI